MPNKSAVIAKMITLARYYANIMQNFGDIQIFMKQPEKIDHIAHLQFKKPEIVNNITPPIYQNHTISEQKNIKTDKVIKITNTDTENTVSTINTLEELKQYTEMTPLCDIKKFATKTVFGDGNPHAKILIIGEAPGQEEDLAGIPFCGKSGELLMNAFACIKLERAKNFYITNNIFWRPPGNRKPTEEELLACKPILNRIVKIINPEIIICVGSVAIQNILQTEESISSLRKQELSSQNYRQKIFAIYHPSYLLRNPSKKYEMYKDLLFIERYIAHIL